MSAKTAQARLSVPRLVEVQHIGPHGVTGGFGTWAALDGVAGPSRPHQFRNLLRMVGSVIGAQRHARMIFGDCLPPARDGFRFGALDIHLDEVHAIELQLSHELVDRSQRYTNRLRAAFAVN